MELKIEHLSKQFKDKTAVNDVNLTLTPGVWGLLGANGAGKTTLMRMIADIMTPTNGAVYYDGKNIRELGEVYRSKFGFLPQDFGYHRDFTVKDYLEYMAALKDIPTRATTPKINHLLDILSLSDVKKKKISNLSGGMKRRVGIAQAMLNDPEILVMDEPTAGLDPGERVRLRNFISEFSHDRIVLISTHIVSDIEYISTVSYTHLRAHETDSYLVCRLLLEKKKHISYTHLRAYETDSYLVCRLLLYKKKKTKHN